MRYVSFILAITIDAFQLLLPIGIASAFFAASASVGWIPILGQIIAGSIDLGGIAVDPIIDTTITATFGTGFIFHLMFSGLLSRKDLLSMRATPFIVAKFIPFVNMFPFYTGMTVRLVMLKRKEERLALSTTSSQEEAEPGTIEERGGETSQDRPQGVSPAARPPASPGGQPREQGPAARLPLVDGIRSRSAANDNVTQVSVPQHETRLAA